ncbi:MAG: hypothetical protein AB1689_16485 [Thermodesulfobacteriota bacterium]
MNLQRLAPVLVVLNLVLLAAVATGRTSAAPPTGAGGSRRVITP